MVAGDGDDFIGIGPGGDEDEFGGVDVFGGDDFVHAAAEDDDAIGGAEEFAVDAIEEAGDKGARFPHAEGDGDIGVEVHFILDVACAAEEFEEHSDDADHGGRGEADDDVLFGEGEGAPECEGVEESEVNEAGEDAAFFEEVGTDAVDGGAVVGIAFGEDGTLFAVDGARGDDGDGVAVGGEVFGPVSEVLSGGDDVGPEGLVDDKYAHV